MAAKRMRRPSVPAPRRQLWPTIYALLLLALLLLPLWAAAAAKVKLAGQRDTSSRPAVSAPRAPSSAGSSLFFRPGHRLHVLPHSDGAGDQAVKPVAWQAVQNYLAAYAPPDLGQDERAAATWFQGHAPALAQVVGQALKEHGISETVEVEVGYFWFDGRSFNGRFVPAGFYPATRVVLGAGDGGNWWCAVFNGMCVAGSWDEEEVQQLAVTAAAGTAQAGNRGHPAPELEVSYRWWLADWWLQRRQPRLFPASKQ